MAKKQISELKEYFKVGKRPTEGQFEDVLDSFIHKDGNVDSLGVASYLQGDGSGYDSTSSTIKLSNGNI